MVKASQTQTNWGCHPVFHCSFELSLVCGSDSQVIYFKCCVWLVLICAPLLLRIHSEDPILLVNPYAWQKRLVQIIWGLSRSIWSSGKHLILYYIKIAKVTHFCKCLTNPFALFWCKRHQSGMCKSDDGVEACEAAVICLVTCSSCLSSAFRSSAGRTLGHWHAAWLTMRQAISYFYEIWARNQRIQLLFILLDLGGWGWLFVFPC